MPPSPTRMGLRRSIAKAHPDQNREKSRRARRLNRPRALRARRFQRRRRVRSLRRRGAEGAAGTLGAEAAGTPIGSPHSGTFHRVRSDDHIAALAHDLARPGLRWSEAHRLPPSNFLHVSGPQEPDAPSPSGGFGRDGVIRPSSSSQAQSIMSRKLPATEESSSSLNPSMPVLADKSARVSGCLATSSERLDRTESFGDDLLDLLGRSRKSSKLRPFRSPFNSPRRVPPDITSNDTHRCLYLTRDGPRPHGRKAARGRVRAYSTPHSSGAHL